MEQVQRCNVLILMTSYKTSALMLCTCSNDNFIWIITPYGTSCSFYEQKHKDYESLWNKYKDVMYLFLFFFVYQRTDHNSIRYILFILWTKTQRLWVFMEQVQRC